MGEERSTVTGRGVGLLKPETFADPYPLARHLRETDPVHWSEELNGWMLTRYADVAAALHDPRFAADRLPQLDRLASMGWEPLRPLFHTMRGMFLFRDAPVHTRLRKLANRGFTRPSVEGLRAEAQRLTEAHVDEVAATGRMDVLSDLAQELPLKVLSLVLGFPADVQPRLRAWSEDLARFFGSFTQTPRQLAAVQATVLEFSEYLRAALQERRHRATPGTDMLSALVQERGDVLTEDEIISSAILIVAAGHVTTTDLIGNSTLALLRDPDQARRVSADRGTPGFLESAVEELLRYESPVQMTARLVREPVDLGGKRIRKGEWLILWLGAANRDPARFSDPDRLDLERTDNKHLAFGSGAHFCLGAPLARMQGQIAIPTLFRRFPAMRLADVPLVWKRNPTLRGLTSLPVVLDPGHTG
jgi:cytochrome P450